MAFFNFPHTRTYDTDLGWLIVEMNRIKDLLNQYLENAVITFADPITWDITEQYTALTMVIDSDGTAYLSKQPVPAGVNITNTDYWLPVFNYDDNINKLRSQIAYNAGTGNTTGTALHIDDLVFWNGLIYKVIAEMPAGTAFIIDTNIEKYTVSDRIQDITTNINTLHDEIIQGDDNIKSQIAYNAENSATTGEALTAGALVFWNNLLYEVLEDMPAGAAFIVGDNIKLSTVSERIQEIAASLKIDNFVRPQDFGAAADGVTDDTAAIRNAVEEAKRTGKTLLFEPGTYIISGTITIDDYIDIICCGIIKAAVSLQSMVDYQVEPKYSGGTSLQDRIDLTRRSVVAGLYLDCNSVADIGLIAGGYLVQYEKLCVVNAVQEGVRLRGITFLHDAYVHTKPNSNSIGYNVLYNDNVLRNCVSLDAHTALRLRGYARISGFDAWIWTPSNYPGSTFIEMAEAGYNDYQLVQIEGCYSDTYSRMFKVHARTQGANVVNCRYQVSPEAADTSDRYILFTPETNDVSTWFQMFRFSGCQFIGGLGNTRTNFTQNGAGRYYIDETNIYHYIANILQHSMFTPTLNAGITENSVQVTAQNGVTTIGLDVTLNGTVAINQYNIIEPFHLDPDIIRPWKYIKGLCSVATSTSLGEYSIDDVGVFKIQPDGTFYISVPARYRNETSVRVNMHATFNNRTLLLNSFTTFTQDNT